LPSAAAGAAFALRRDAAGVPIPILPHFSSSLCARERYARWRCLFFRAALFSMMRHSTRLRSREAGRGAQRRRRRLRMPDADGAATACREARQWGRQIGKAMRQRLCAMCKRAHAFTR